MAESAVETVAGAILAMLRQGLRQDDSVLSRLTATLGESTPDAVAAALEDREGADAAVVAGLLLFPGREALKLLEPVLEAARLTPEEALAVAGLVAAACARTSAVWPDGRRVDLPLEPGEAQTMVSRLRLPNTPPKELSDVLSGHYPKDDAPGLKVALRHCRLEWTGARVEFLAALLGGLAPGPEAIDVLEWAISYLEALSGGLDPREALGACYLRLANRLRRAMEFHSALAASSFEVMFAQGARVALPHPDVVRRELALLDAACMAVTGRPAWTLASSVEMDLGEFGDGESVITALGGP